MVQAQLETNQAKEEETTLLKQNDKANENPESHTWLSSDLQCWVGGLQQINL